MEEMARWFNIKDDRENEAKYVDELADYVAEKGTNVFLNTGYWHAVFNIQIVEKGRPANGYTIKAWAKDLDPGMIADMKYYHETPDSFMLDEQNYPIAVAWKWSSWYSNRMSAGGYVEVLKFEQCKEHELGAWDISNQKLRSRGTIQPSIAAPGGKFVCGGNEIARPEFNRDDSCMLNLFLEWSAGRLKTHRDQLNHAALYKMATKQDLIDGQPGGVTLHEAEAWLKLWRLSGRAIDQAGNLVWSYDPETRNKHIVGGAVWRLMIHNEHVWLCDVDTKSFDQHYGGGEVVPPHERPEVSPDISEKVSNRWRGPPEPNGELLEIVTDLESVLALPETCEEAMTNGEPEQLAIELWEAGYEPGYIGLAMGVIESFSIRIGERSIRIRRAVDVDLRDDQVPFAMALTKRGQIVVEEEAAKLRHCFQPTDGLSVYSPDLKRMLDCYNRGPRCGLLTDTPPVGLVVGFDVSKAYTECMSLITHVLSV